MGVLNLTPDSFSGDGLGFNTDAALTRAKSFTTQGADIIDIGGESTRPNGQVISLDEEIKRVIPTIERLTGELSVPISIDTYKASVARLAVAAGATMINDVWGLRQDAELARVAAEAGVPLVLASNQRGRPVANIMSEVVSDLERAIHQAVAAGVPWDNIIVDPGIGFGKNLKQNLAIMRHLAELKQLERPILLGTSRKSMIGLVLDLPVEKRLLGTAATVAIGITNGVDIIRVHDVKQMKQVSQMSDAIVRGVA